MTIQTPDFLYYGDVKHHIKGVKGSGLFTGQDFGIEPDIFSTSCYRGYQAIYHLFDQQLVLAEITILITKTDQAIDGIYPVQNHQGSLYQGLHLPCRFTGGLILSEGYGQPSVLQMHLIDGVLQDVIRRPTEHIFNFRALHYSNETIPPEFQSLMGYRFIDFLF